MASMDRAHQLAEFLRARRERVKPEDVGIQGAARRRVPGLRREELAMLAGLSTDYYTRLEQGHDHHPSEPVLEGLARALRLDDDATAHLFALSHAAPARADPGPAPAESVRPGLQDLVDAWSMTPALVLGRRLDVLASNPVARQLSPISQPGTNLVRAVFLDPDVRERYDDLKTVLATSVAHLRATVASDLDNAYLRDLVGELSLKSDEFCQLWARHDVRIALTGETSYRHPVAGAMRLRYQTLAVGGSDRQTLFVVYAAPGSPDAQALAFLATLPPDLDTSTPRASARNGR